MVNKICDLPDIPAHDLVFHIFNSKIIMANRCDKSPVNRKIFMFSFCCGCLICVDSNVQKPCQSSLPLLPDFFLFSLTRSHSNCFVIEIEANQLMHFFLDVQNVKWMLPQSMRHNLLDIFYEMRNSHGDTPQTDWLSLTWSTHKCKMTWLTKLINIMFCSIIIRRISFRRNKIRFLYVFVVLQQKEMYSE